MMEKLILAIIITFSMKVIAPATSALPQEASSFTPQSFTHHLIWLSQR